MLKLGWDKLHPCKVTLQNLCSGLTTDALKAGLPSTDVEVNLGVRVTSLVTRDLRSSRTGLTTVLGDHRPLLQISRGSVGARTQNEWRAEQFGLGAEEQGAERSSEWRVSSSGGLLKMLWGPRTSVTLQSLP